LENLVVEPKTLGMGTLSGWFSKGLQKPWSSKYSTKMFSNDFVNMELDMGVEELVVL
jgi:hypothetical protein